MHTPSAQVARLCDALQLSYRLIASVHELLPDLHSDFQERRVSAEDLLCQRGNAIPQSLASVVECFECGGVLFFDEWEDPRALEIEDSRDFQSLVAHLPRRTFLIADRSKRLVIARQADGSMRIRDLRASGRPGDRPRAPFGLSVV